MAHNIGVVGFKESVMPFKVMGFDVCYVENSTEAKKAIDQMASQHYGVIYVNELLLSELTEVVMHYQSQLTPALIGIPTHEGSTGYSQQMIQDYVEKAVGQNIL